MTHRTLSDLLDPLTAIGLLGSITVTDIDVTLPVDIGLRDGELSIGAPQWRWRTDFDADPGRLRVRLEAVAS